jgi:hypothetical protein
LLGATYALPLTITPAIGLENFLGNEALAAPVTVVPVHELHQRAASEVLRQDVVGAQVGEVRES